MNKHILKNPDEIKEYNLHKVLCDKKNQKELDHGMYYPQLYIPFGEYCEDKNGVCLFYNCANIESAKNDTKRMECYMLSNDYLSKSGYCHYLKTGDFYFENTNNLTTKKKCCNINTIEISEDNFVKCRHAIQPFTSIISIECHNFKDKCHLEDIDICKNPFGYLDNIFCRFIYNEQEHILTLNIFNEIKDLLRKKLSYSVMFKNITDLKEDEKKQYNDIIDTYKELVNKIYILQLFIDSNSYNDDKIIYEVFLKKEHADIVFRVSIGQLRELCQCIFSQQ